MEERRQKGREIKREGVREESQYGMEKINR